MPADPQVLSDLDRLGLAYEVVPCDPDLADTVQFCEAYGVPFDIAANAILIASKKPEGHNAICVALANSRLDVNGVIRRKLGVRKLSFASAEVTRELTVARQQDHGLRAGDCRGRVQNGQDQARPWSAGGIEWFRNRR